MDNDTENTQTESTVDMEKQKELIAHLNHQADFVITTTAKNSNINVPDLQALHAKYSLLVDNEKEMELLNYAMFLYVNLKIYVIGELMQQAKESIQQREDKPETGNDSIQ